MPVGGRFGGIILPLQVRFQGSVSGSDEVEGKANRCMTRDRSYLPVIHSQYLLIDLKRANDFIT